MEGTPIDAPGHYAATRRGHRPISSCTVERCAEFLRPHLRPRVSLLDDSRASDTSNCFALPWRGTRFQAAVAGA